MRWTPNGFSEIVGGHVHRIDFFVFTEDPAGRVEVRKTQIRSITMAATCAPRTVTKSTHHRRRKVPNRLSTLRRREVLKQGVGRPLYAVFSVVPNAVVLAMELVGSGLFQFRLLLELFCGDRIGLLFRFSHQRKISRAAHLNLTTNAALYLLGLLLTALLLLSLAALLTGSSRRSGRLPPLRRRGLGGRLPPRRRRGLDSLLGRRTAVASDSIMPLDLDVIGAPTGKLG